MMADVTVIAAVIGGCLAGGFVKGASGSGLPQTAIPLIALVTDVPTAIAVVQIPAMSINLFQLRVRDHPQRDVFRHWPMFVTLFFTTIIGVALLRAAPPQHLFVFMAAITLATIAFLSLKPNFTLPPSMRLPVGLPLAACAGLSGGLSSLGGVFLIPYFLSLNLPKDVFVATVSTCYLAIIVPIIGFFLYWDLVDPHLFLYSIAAVVPSLAGMWIGERVRRRIDDRQFRRVVLAVLFMSACGLVYKAITI